MKNRNLKLGVLVVAAVTLFTVTGFASTGSNGGYEALKQVIKESHQEANYSNATISGSFQALDNGKVITSAVGKVKGNRDESKMSLNTQVELAGKKQNLSFYKDGEATYLVDETNAKNYKLVNIPKDENNDSSAFKSRYSNGKHSLSESGEAILDYFVGDLKSQFELTNNSDGSKIISLDLNQNEIPTVINLFAGAAFEDGNRKFKLHDVEDNKDITNQLMEKLPFLKDFNGIENELPALKQDVKLTSVYLKLNVDASNSITSIEVKTQVNGKDESGTEHNISLAGTATISDLGKTTIDSFNADGKKIENVDVSTIKRN